MTDIQILMKIKNNGRCRGLFLSCKTCPLDKYSKEERICTPYEYSIQELSKYTIEELFEGLL